MNDMAHPSPEAAAVSQQLIARLNTQITNNGGIIDFDQYMHQALYAPGLGYYVNGSIKLGADGDYVTAPEISPLWGRCLANSIRPLLAQLSQPIIMELGAGSGSMACELLLALEQQNALPTQYWILEPSGDLQQRQYHAVQKSCPHLLDRVCWLSALPTSKFNGIMLGNEVVDAIACKRFRKQHGHIVELGVGLAQERFTYKTKTLSPELQKLLDDIEPELKDSWPEGYTNEARPIVSPWLASLAECLTSGWMLWIDYGYNESEYYRPERSDGTLMCYYRHRGHSDPFVYPGLQDITAHVNFTRLGQAALANNLEVISYTTQAEWLIHNGLEQSFSELLAADPENQNKHTQAMRRLVDPRQMGEQFKVMLLGKNAESHCDFTSYERKQLL